jgi:hypothetical protein
MFWTLFIIALYFLPVANAYHRKHKNAAAIGATNILLGWTAIGWIIALIWSQTAVEKSLQK